MTDQRLMRRSILHQVGSSGGRLVGIAKGAGMIEPDMATMLVYLVTDLQVRGTQRKPRRWRCADRCFGRFACVPHTIGRLGGHAWVYR